MIPLLHHVALPAPDYRATCSTPLGAVSFRLINTSEDRLGSLSICVGASTIELPDFAERSSRDTQECCGAELRLVLLMSSLLIVGARTVCQLGKDGNLRQLFKVFRNERDDAGFYRGPDLLVEQSYLLLTYESGLACMTLDGELRWHERLTYDDALMRVESQQIWLCNEHVNDGEPWSIKVVDGTRSL